MTRPATSPRGDFDKKLGSRVRDVRKHYGWTQQQLAERVSMTQHNLSRYESGEYSLSAWYLAVLSNIFAITIHSWFCDDTTWQQFVRKL